jgi:hypothetical protein
MIPKLSRYLDRLYATIHSRHEIVVYDNALTTPIFPGSPSTSIALSKCSRLLPLV